SSAVMLALPSLWRGKSSMHPDRPPSGWVWGPNTYRHWSWGVMLSPPILLACSLALLTPKISQTLAGVLLLVTLALTLIWLSIMLFARPRFLIPPSWRPEPKWTNLARKHLRSLRGQP
ncbi:MAG: hypothetical protein ACRC0L_08900, partial [Angustibacter sp.]